MSDTLQKIKNVLHASVDSTPERVSAFFQTGPGEYAHHDRFLGIRVPTLRKIAQEFVSLPLEDLQFFIQSPFNEERFLALVILTQRYRKASAPQKNDIYNFYRSHLNHVSNWNLVDSSAHLIMGAHLFERDCAVLEELADSHNLWERRIAMVATWYFIRKSALDWTFRLAVRLQRDPHHLMHKAVGWMLREAGKKDETRLLSFLSDHAHHMPRTMVRYAMERLSQEQKALVTHSAVTSS